MPVSKKTIRLSVFFVVCCSAGVAILFCLFSPQLNPDFIHSILFPTDTNKAFEESMIRMIRDKHSKLMPPELAIIIKGKIEKGEFASIGLPEPKDVLFNTADGTKLHGWYFQVPSAKKVILYSPHETMFLSTAGGLIKGIVKANSSVFIYDYRGCGTSAGKSTIATALCDGLAAYDYLANTEKVSADKIVNLGYDFGCFVAAKIQTERPCAAMIMHRPADSLKVWADDRIATMWMIPASMYPDSVKNISRDIASNHAPILILRYAKADISPKLIASVGNPKKIVTLKGSGRYLSLIRALFDPTNFNEYSNAIAAFLAQPIAAKYSSDLNSAEFPEISPKAQQTADSTLNRMFDSVGVQRD